MCLFVCQICVMKLNLLLNAKSEKHAGDDVTLMSLATFVFLRHFFF